jgi:hypothetical protein
LTPRQALDKLGLCVLSLLHDDPTRRPARNVLVWQPTNDRASGAQATLHLFGSSCCAHPTSRVTRPPSDVRVRASHSRYLNRRTACRLACLLVLSNPTPCRLNKSRACLGPACTSSIASVAVGVTVCGEPPHCVQACLPPGPQQPDAVPPQQVACLGPACTSSFASVAVGVAVCGVCECWCWFDDVCPSVGVA